MTDIEKFIKKNQPSKYKVLSNGIEVRSNHDLQGAIIKARECIKSLKLALEVIDTAEMAERKCFDVREVAV